MKMDKEESSHEAMLLNFDPDDKEITSDIKISYNGKSVTVRALWDTGATKSCVSKQVIEKLEAVSSRDILCITDEGVTQKDPVFLLDLELFPTLEINNHEMVRSSIGSRLCKAIIGMDIIMKGQFFFINNGGKYMAMFKPWTKTSQQS